MRVFLVLFILTNVFMDSARALELSPHAKFIRDKFQSASLLLNIQLDTKYFCSFYAATHSGNSKDSDNVLVAEEGEYSDVIIRIGEFFSLPMKYEGDRSLRGKRLVGPIGSDGRIYLRSSADGQSLFLELATSRRFAEERVGVGKGLCSSLADSSTIAVSYGMCVLMAEELEGPNAIAFQEKAWPNTLNIFQEVAAPGGPGQNILVPPRGNRTKLNSRRAGHSSDQRRSKKQREQQKEGDFTEEMNEYSTGGTDEEVRTLYSSDIDEELF